MRTNSVLTRALTTAVVATSVTAAMGTQSMKAMGQPSKGDTSSVTYTGCVVSANHGGTFLLTNVDSSGAESMRHDTKMEHHDMAMKHDDTAMQSSAATTMQHEQTPMTEEKMDAMPSTSFALAGSTNLAKHVGHKVSVTGSLTDGAMGTTRQDLSTLTIKTLKVRAKSCS